MKCSLMSDAPNHFQGLRSSVRRHMAVVTALSSLVASVSLLTFGSVSPASADAAAGIDAWGQTTNSPNLGPPLPAGETPAYMAISGTNGLTVYALMTDGKLYAYGAGGLGQLGNGLTSDSFSAWVQPLFPGGTTITQVSARGSHVMALTSDGRVFVWGQNNLEDLGVPYSTAPYSDVPLQYTQLPVSATAVSAGYENSMALGTDGNVYTWGDAEVGQLGNNTYCNCGETAPTAATIPPGVTVHSILAGTGNAMFESTAGQVYGWGWNGNAGGLLGTGSCGGIGVPTRFDLPGATTALMSSNPGTLSYAIGDATSYVITSSGAVYSAGDDSAGGLGNGTTNNVCDAVPVEASMPAGVTASAISADDDANAEVIASDNKVYGWGQNNYGQLGNGTNTDSYVPTPVVLPAGIVPSQLASSTAQTAVLLERAAQTVSFLTSPPAGAVFGGPPYSPVDASADSGLVPTLSIDPSATSVCQLSGSSVSFVGAGTCTIDANQSGSAGYAPATQAQQSFTVAQASQSVSITSSAPTNAVFQGATYTATASATSGLTPTITVDGSSSSVCSIASNVVSFIGVGTCTLDANQAGNSDYVAAPQSQQSFAVGKGSQSVSFTSSAPSNAVFQGATYTATASATSGLTPTITVDGSSSSVCSIASNVVSFIGVGTCTLDANQAGNSDYVAAPQSQQAFSVGPASQSVSFTSTAPSNAIINGPTYTAAASATSGLPVSITTDPTSASVCSITGIVVRFIGAGTCTLDGNQAGNSDYLAAPQVKQSFAVGNLEILTTSPLPVATPGNSYTVALQALGGRMPYKWKRFSGVLPKGLKVKSNGTVTGTPRAHAIPENYTFTVQVQDASHPRVQVTKTLSLTLL